MLYNYKHLNFVTYFFFSVIISKDLPQNNLIAELMSNNPEDRPSATLAIERLNLIAQEAAEKDFVEDFAEPFERLFLVETEKDEEEDLWDEKDSVEEEESFDNVLRKTMRIGSCEVLERAMEKLFS